MSLEVRAVGLRVSFLQVEKPRAVSRVEKGSIGRPEGLPAQARTQSMQYRVEFAPDRPADARPWWQNLARMPATPPTRPSSGTTPLACKVKQGAGAFNLGPIHQKKCTVGRPSSSTTLVQGPMPSSQRGHRLRRIDQLVEKHRNPTIGMFDGAGMIADLIVACRKEPSNSMISGASSGHRAPCPEMSVCDAC